MSITFEELTRRWLSTVAIVTLKPSGYRSYESICRNHLLPVFGDMVIETIDMPAVELYAAERIKAGLSTRTVVNHVQVIRRLLAYAFDNGLVTSHGVTDVCSPRQEPVATRLRYLTPEELHRLFEVTPTSWRVLLAMAALTGLRKGEQLALTFKDVDFIAKTVSVSKTMKNGVVSSPKTEWSIGTIPLPESLVLPLRERQKAVSDPDGLVFCRRDGSPLPDSLPNRILAKALQKAGLPKVTWHEMGRHSWVVAHLKAGTDIPTLTRLGRWKTADVLLSTYAHVLPASGGEAVRRLDELVKLDG